MCISAPDVGFPELALESYRKQARPKSNLRLCDLPSSLSQQAVWCLCIV